MRIAITTKYVPLMIPNGKLFEAYTISSKCVFKSCQVGLQKKVNIVLIFVISNRFQVPRTFILQLLHIFNHIS